MACVVWYIFYMICVYSELTWFSCAVQLTRTPEIVTVTEVNDVIVCVNVVPRS